MKIEWSLDLELGENIDQYNLFGTFSIDDGKTKIFDEPVCLTNWLDSLIDGLSSLESCNSLESDLITEPDPLIFNFSPNGAHKISYQGKTINLSGTELFKKCLINSCSKLLNRLRTDVPEYDTTSVAKIEKFLSEIKKPGLGKA